MGIIFVARTNQRGIRNRRTCQMLRSETGAGVARPTGKIHKAVDIFEQIGQQIASGGAWIQS